MSQLKEDWKRQINELTKDEKEKETTHNQVKQTPRKVKAKDCVEHTLSHSFERASVVSERKLLQEAYKHSIGDATITLDEIKSEFYQNKKIVHVKEKYKTLCTTKEVLLEEKQMVELAKSGKGKFTPLYKTLPPINLDGQQKEAIEHVLTTRNQISIIRGAAGTGKTTLMKEAIHHIEKAGRQVITIAPTAQASRGVLREEGFKDAETVAKFINDPLMQERINNQFLWVDEAGLLGTRDMKALLQIAKKKTHD
ncbi:MAG: AAA family ATPase [Bacteroidetes bacterium]|nr:AAA family ATPase [Bacteroidota bacterium]